jgi:type IV secretory pathway VirB2 component (pilin)
LNDDLFAYQAVDRLSSSVFDSCQWCVCFLHNSVVAADVVAKHRAKAAKAVPVAVPVAAAAAAIRQPQLTVPQTSSRQSMANAAAVVVVVAVGMAEMVGMVGMSALLVVVLALNPLQASIMTHLVDLQIICVPKCNSSLTQIFGAHRSSCHLCLIFYS